MPLAPLPPSNTARYKLQYIVGGLEHEVQNRVAPGTTALQASSGFQSMFSTLSAELWSVTITGMTYADAGSDIFNPVTYSGGTSYGLGAPGGEEATRSASFVGRTAGGRKARFFVYGWKTNLLDNARVTDAENAQVDSWLDILAAYTIQFLAIDSLKPIYKRYANIDHNDHWQKVVRG